MIAGFFLTFFIFFLISYQYKSINKSTFITPLAPAHIAFAISILTVIYLYNEGYIPNIDFILIMLQQIIFLAFLLLIPTAIKKINYNFYVDFKLKKSDFRYSLIIFTFGVLTSLIYILLLWTSYDSGDYRLLLNKKFKILAIIKDLFVTWSISLLSLVYSISKKKKYFCLILIFFLIISFAGSKGSLLVYFLVFTFFYFQFNKVKSKTRAKIILILPIITSLPSIIMYGQNFVYILVDRILKSADIYFYSYVIGDYSKLIGYYNPIMYIIHPISSVIGIPGYDFPLGAKILETANLDVTGVGPNPHLTILNLVFFEKCIYSITLNTIFYGTISLITVYLAFKLISKRKLSSYIKVLIFVVLYTNHVNLFFDIGFFEYNIILVLIGYSIYIIINFVKETTKRDKIATN